MCISSVIRGEEHRVNVYTPVNADRTHIDWTYSFRLDTRRFPGMFGGLGEFLFRSSFWNANTLQ